MCAKNWSRSDQINTNVQESETNKLSTRKGQRFPSIRKTQRGQLRVYVCGGARNPTNCPGARRRGNTKKKQKKSKQDATTTHNNADRTLTNDEEEQCYRTTNDERRTTTNTNKHQQTPTNNEQRDAALQ